VASGTFTISSAADNGGGNYNLVVDSTASMTANDHVGAFFGGSADGVYRINTVTDATNVTVDDVLTEENGGVFGIPVAGVAWFGTPTTGLGLSKAPYGGKPWSAAGRRNEHLTAPSYVVGGTDVSVTDGGTGASTAGAALSNLGGQPLDASLTELSALSLVAGDTLYIDATPEVQRLAKGTDGDVLTLASGIPSWATPTVYQTVDASLTELSALSLVSGDVLYIDGSNEVQRLAKGSDGEVLTLASGIPSWAAAGAGSFQPLDAILTDLSGITFATGDVIYYDGANLTNLGVGSNGQVLKLSGGVPIWSTDLTGGGAGTNALLDGTVHSDTTAGTVAQGDLMTGQGASPLWTRLAVGAADTLLATDGTDVLYRSLDTTLATLGATQGMILRRSGTAWEALGLGTNNTVLSSDGTDVLYRTVPALLAAALGDTRGDILRRGTSAWEVHALGADNTVLASDGTDVAYETLTSLLDSAFGSTRGQILYRNATVWTTLAVGTNGQLLESDGTDPAWATVSSSGTVLPQVAGGRISLSSTESVPTSDQTGKTVIYYLPHKDQKIALYDGSTAWEYIDISSSGINFTPSSPTASRPYDIFVYNNSGTATLEELVWTNDTTRATALVRQDGVWSKTGALTRRYVGTVYSNSSSQFTDAEQSRLVWNMDNRVVFRDWGHDGTDSWTDSGTSFSAMNSGNAAWKHEFVIGLDEVPMQGMASLTCADANNGTFAIALDGTTPTVGDVTWARRGGSGAGADEGDESDWAARPGIGYHYLQTVGRGLFAQTVTFYGDHGVTNQYANSGMLTTGER